MDSNSSVHVQLGFRVKLQCPDLKLISRQIFLQTNRYLFRLIET